MRRFFSRLCFGLGLWMLVSIGYSIARADVVASAILVILSVAFLLGWDRLRKPEHKSTIDDYGNPLPSREVKCRTP